jgi:hypothetical protein
MTNYIAKPGTYKFGRSENGTDQIGVEFEVVDGVEKGKTFIWYGFFSEKTIERTMTSLRHCGWTCDDLSVLTGFGSKNVSIVVEEEVYQGKSRTKVQWVNSLDDHGVRMKSELPAAGLKALASRLKGAALASRGAVATKPTGQPATGRKELNVPENDAEEVPFS